MQTDEEWGQFITIHPEMYEYERDVHEHYNKYVVRQRIVQSIPSVPSVPKIPSYKQIQLHEPFATDNMYRHLLHNNPPRFLIICAINLASFVCKFFKRTNN